MEKPQTKKRTKILTFYYFLKIKIEMQWQSRERYRVITEAVLR